MLLETPPNLTFEKLLQQSEFVGNFQDMVCLVLVTKPCHTSKRVQK